MTSSADELYRREQEEFISNHGGSSSRDVILAILPNVCGILLTSSTMALFDERLNKNVKILFEFCLNVLPSVLCCTILSESITIVCLGMLAITIVNIIVIVTKNRGKIEKTSLRPYNDKKRPFVTNFRALTNLLTAICILAVDFRAFPRKFAKTEIYGYSLMDTGVGLFVIGNALVAPETRNSEETDERSFVKKMAGNSKACVKNSAPLLLIGIGRFLAIEMSSYQTHVTEYGVHWNFFITLAFVKMLTSTISSFIAYHRYSLISGIFVIGIHEWALDSGGLKNWVLGNSPRIDFVSANREGLCSVPGYVGLYFIGIAIGRLIRSTYENREKPFANESRTVSMKFFQRPIEFEYNDSMILCVKLSIIACKACAATIYCDWRYRVSRRLANAGYCCWIVTLACALLTLLLLVEIITDFIANLTRENSQSTKKRNEERGTRKKRVGFNLDRTDENDQSTFLRVPEILDSINYNGLLFFLLANLLTGLVNMSTRTLYANDSTTIQIMLGYIAVCILVALVLYRYKIQMKL